MTKLMLTGFWLAMATGLADSVRDMGWLSDLVSENKPKPGKRGPYKKKQARQFQTALLPKGASDYGNRQKGGSRQGL